MKTIHGDLVEMAWEGKFDTIVHGCNCMGRMGAGIACQIAEKFPQAEQVDLSAHEDGRAVPGAASFTVVKDMNGVNFRIINAYTQFYPGSGDISGDWDTPRQRLNWIDTAFKNLAQVTGLRERIGIPMIGAGLAGGNWSAIKQVIENRMYRHKNFTLVLYKPKR